MWPMPATVTGYNNHGEQGDQSQLTSVGHQPEKRWLQISEVKFAELPAWKRPCTDYQRFA